MFGIFCEDASKIWAAGWNESIYYSSDGGATWVNKNCGIDPGNLDDIWFKSPNQGWVVGQDIYRFSNDRVDVSRDSIFFGNNCYPGEYYDTVYVENISFNAANFVISLEGRHPFEFELLIPETDLLMTACEMLEIPIRFNPNTVGLKEATIKILQNGNPYYVKLVGKTYESTVAIDDTLIYVRNAPVGKTTPAGISFASRDMQDSILQLETLYNDVEISNDNTLPVGFFGDAADLLFSITPTDTGWVTARYRVHFDICNKDTTITIMAYGTSPIIESDTRFDFNQQCMEESISKIEIENNGNSYLKIDEAFFLKTPTDFEILGWASGSELPVYIEPGEADTIIVRYLAIEEIAEQNTLRLVNNDFTTVRGIKNIYDIALVAEVERPKLEVNVDYFNFGDICLGDTLTITTDISNIGSIDAAVYKYDITGDDFNFRFSNGNDYLTLKPGESEMVNITFIPKSAGVQVGYLLLLNEQCKDTLKIEFSGRGIESSLSSNPIEINELVQRKEPLAKTFEFTNTGNTDLVIKGVTPIPVFAEMNFTYSPLGDQTLAPGESITYTFNFLFDIDTTYSGELCLEIESECGVEQCIPTSLKSHSLHLVFEPTQLNFDDAFCTPSEQTEVFTIRNTGVNSDFIEVIRLEGGSGAFSLEGIPDLTHEIKANETVRFDVKFLPQTPGEYSAKVIVESENMYGDIVEIEVSGNYYLTKSTIDRNQIAFGEFEVCDEIVSSTITLSNSGNYDDIVKINRINNSPAIYTDPANQISVPNGGEASITVFLDPTMMSDPGSYSQEFTLVSEICPDILDLNVDFTIIKPRLTVEPASLDFGKVWITEDDTQSINLTNNSKRTIEVKDALINPDEYLLELLDDPKGIYNPGDSKEIRLRLNATEVKDISTRLVLFTESSCKDTSYIPITGRVPDEEYVLTLKIGRYERTNNTPVTFEVDLENSSSYIDASGIDLEFSYHPYMFFPMKLYVGGMDESNEVPIVIGKGFIEAQIPENLAKDLLKVDKTIMYISGLAFSDPDDSTDLVIDRFDVTTSKDLTINSLPGKLVVEPHCGTTIGFRLRYLPEIDGTFDNYVTDDDLDLNINVDQDVKVFVKITDYMGRNHSTEYIQLRKGDNSVNLDVSGYSSGTYFLKIQSEFVQIYDYQFIIIR